MTLKVRRSFDSSTDRILLVQNDPEPFHQLIDEIYLTTFSVGDFFTQRLPPVPVPGVGYESGQT